MISIELIKILTAVLSVLASVLAAFQLSKLKSHSKEQNTTARLIVSSRFKIILFVILALQLITLAITWFTKE